MLSLTLCWLLNPNTVGMLFDSVPVVFHPLCLFPTLSLFHLLVPIHPLLLSLSSPGLSLLLNTLILHQHILSSSSNPSKRGSSACQVLCHGSAVVASSSMFCIWGFFLLLFLYMHLCHHYSSAEKTCSHLACILVGLLRGLMPLKGNDLSFADPFMVHFSCTGQLSEQSRLQLSVCEVWMLWGEQLHM